MSDVKRNKKGQFEKGNSGNPSGKPKGKSITKMLRAYMLEIDTSTGLSRIDTLVHVLFESARKGDLQAIKLIMDRVDGLPIQYIEQTTKEPIKVFSIPGIDHDEDDEKVSISNPKHEA